MTTKKIKKILRKSHPHIVKKAKKPFQIKYPKLFLIVGMIFLSYYIFKNPEISNQISILKELSYMGIFISGAFLSFGFSAPFAIGFLVVSNPQNVFLATLFGALGAMISDVVIFKVIKFSFMNEFRELERTKTIKKIEKIVNKNFSVKIKHYLLYLFAGIIIATPLPDEAGVSMLAGLTTIKPKILAITSFLLHAITIFLILILSV
jgi:hypothetical protein